MGRGIDALVECPFFISQGDNFIKCESYISQTKTSFEFRFSRDKKKYVEEICSCGGGKRCRHYRLMSILYERGEING